MGLTSKVFLDNRYTKRDGSQAIKIRYTINRKSLEISTGFTVNPRYWNESKMQIKTSCKEIANVSRINNMILKMRIGHEDRITQLQENGELAVLSLKELKGALLGKLDAKGLLEYCSDVVNDLKKSNRIGNARVYKTLYNSLSTYLDSKDQVLKDINHRWLISYETWYLSKGNSLNGLSVHMRTLRALINRAIKNKLLSKENYAFENYTIKSEKTQKRAIANEDLLKIKAYNPTTKQKKRAKDYFLMSFYLMGASFIDLAFLKMENIVNGRVNYRRKKTGQLHSIKISPALQTILDKYIRGKSDDDFVLNVINSDVAAIQHLQARDELKRYNKRLKEIGLECGIKQTLTSYVARHSFATIAKFKDVPIPVISQALGHEDTKTTQIYLAQFGDDMMDKFNEMIIAD